MSSGPVEDYQEAFTRIEAEVEKGNTGLGDLGFWRLCRQVKLEPALAEHWADEIGRIDQKAFRARVRPLFPVWLGNLVLLIASLVLIWAVPVAFGFARGSDVSAGLVGAGIDVPQPFWAGLIAVAAAGGLSVTLHDLAHWAVGRLVGLRFTAYFLDGPLRIQPGLKIDYASYLRTSPRARAWMHASGALASKIAPFAVFVPIYLKHRAAGYDLFPSWAVWGILAIGVVQILTDLLFSTKSGDWKKVIRERRLARSMESIPRR